MKHWCGSSVQEHVLRNALLKWYMCCIIVPFEDSDCFLGGRSWNAGGTDWGINHGLVLFAGMVIDRGSMHGCVFCIIASALPSEHGSRCSPQVGLHPSLGCSNVVYLRC